MEKITCELRRQHELIREHIVLMESLVEKGISGINQARQFERRIHELGNLLTLHLGREDSHLYPQLINSSDEKIRKLSRSFVAELGGLARFFEGYLAQWSVAETILSDVEVFLEDTENLLASLIDRIEREEILLFPLVSVRRSAWSAPLSTFTPATAVGLGV